MLCFTKEEAKRLIGFVNMGAAFANLVNALLVGICIRYLGGSSAILPMQMGLLVAQLFLNATTRQWLPPTVDKPSEADAAKKALADEVAAPADWKAQLFSDDKWYMNTFTQLISLWAFITVASFSVIEFQYNAVLAHELDADGIAQVTAAHSRPPPAPLKVETGLTLCLTPPTHDICVSRITGLPQVTANLASVASIGQTIVNLFITPFLLQHVGVWAALVVTPVSYILGESLILSSQSVATVFTCRSMDFIFRCALPPTARGRALSSSHHH